MKNQGAPADTTTPTTTTAAGAAAPAAEAPVAQTTPAQEAALQRVSDQVFSRLTKGTSAPAAGDGKPDGDGKQGDGKPSGDGKPDGEVKGAKEEKDKGKAQTPAKAGEDPKTGKPATSKSGDEPHAPERRRFRRSREAPSSEEITAAATAAATRAVAEVIKPKEAPKAAEVDPNAVHPLFKGSAEEIQYLSKLPQYKNLITQYNEFGNRVEEYIRNWRKEHPGEKFDDQDAEHAEFFATAPAVDEKDWARASGAVEARRTVHEELKPIIKEKEALKQQKEVEAVAAEIAPVIRNGTGVVTRDIIATLAGDRWKDEMTPQEREALVREITEDPIEGPVLQTHLDALQPVVELATLALSPKGEMFINERDPVTAKTLEAVRRDIALVEQSMDGVEDADGRVFVPREEFEAMPEAQKKLHYTVDPALMAEFYCRHAKRMVGEAVKVQRANAEKIAKKIGFVPKSDGKSVPNSGQETGPSGGQQTTPEARRAAARTDSVSLSGGGPAVAASGGGEPKTLSAYDKAFRSMTGY